MLNNSTVPSAASASLPMADFWRQAAIALLKSMMSILAKKCGEFLSFHARSCDIS